MQRSSEQDQRSGGLDRLVEEPARRTNHPRRGVLPVNQRDTTSGTSRSETTTTVSREERPLDTSCLMWSRPIPSPWHIYKPGLLKFNLQAVNDAADAMRMLNGAKFSINGLYLIVGVDWLVDSGGYQL